METCQKLRNKILGQGIMTVLQQGRERLRIAQEAGRIMEIFLAKQYLALAIAMS